MIQFNEKMMELYHQGQKLAKLIIFELKLAFS